MEEKIKDFYINIKNEEEQKDILKLIELGYLINNKTWLFYNFNCFYSFENFKLLNNHSLFNIDNKNYNILTIQELKDYFYKTKEYNLIYY